MIKHTYIALCTIFLFQHQAQANSAIEITADSAELLLKSQIHTFNGNVKLIRNNNYIHADKLVVIKNETISTFKASSVHPNLVAFNFNGSQGTGDLLFYDANIEVLTITGSATLLNNGSVLNAKKIIYNVKDDSVISGDSSTGGVVMKISH